MTEHLNNPTILSINATNGPLLIDHDPNWDDQVLYFNGELTKNPDGSYDTSYTSAPGEAVAASVYGWSDTDGGPNMVGIYYAGPNNQGENRNMFMMTIGWDGGGKLSVTDQSTLPDMTIRYSVVAQTKWVLVLKFEDA